MNMINGLPVDLVAREVKLMQEDDLAAVDREAIEAAREAATHRIPGADSNVVDVTAMYRNSPEAAKQRQEQAAQAVQERRQAQIDDAVLAVVDADPPSAEDLGIDVTGFGPARAALIRYVAWRDDLRQRRDDLEAGRAALFAKIGAPAVTRGRLQEVIEQDKTGLLRWMLKGGKALDEPAVRSFERQQIEQQLAADSHMAEVARDALDKAEFELEILSRRADAVERRHDSFVNAALLEAGAEIAARYGEQINALRATLTEWCAMRSIAGGGPSSASISLPRLGIPNAPASIEITENDARRAAAPWRDRSAALIADSRANLDSNPTNPGDNT